MPSDLELRCPASAAHDPGDGWRCPVCHAPLDLGEQPPLEPLPAGGEGLWRYRRWLGPVRHPLTLGEPTTPLVALGGDGWPGSALLKLEGALPTGSFKDRGAALMVSLLAERGARRLVIDSSGNAGASLAAYCARAGLPCEVFVPAAASAAKLAQVEAYGARTHLVAGSRAEVTRVAMQAAEREGLYASHAWSALFLAGTQTFAFEVAEQLGRAPDVVVLPVGAGTLLLGASLGFARLVRAGRIARPPRLVGVQSAACPPLARAWAAGAAVPARVEVADTAAEGVKIAAPPRGTAILRAIRASGGALVEVDDDALAAARRDLARAGVYVEPTAALGPAALPRLAAAGRLDPRETVVVAVTGNGLKSPPPAKTAEPALAPA